MTWTDAELKTVLQRGQVRVIGEASRPPTQSGAVPHEALALERVSGHAVSLFATEPERMLAERQQYQSKTEMRFATMLETKRYAGHLQRWWYEPFSLRLAPKTYYRPDFLVQYGPDQSPYKLELVCYEVKGFWRDDARVKIKVAAARYVCFVFVAVQWKRGGWVYETIPIY